MAENPNDIQYTQMTAEEFVKIWKGEYVGNVGYEKYYTKDFFGESQLTFENIEVEDDIKITGLISDYTLPHLLLYACKTGNIVISGFEVGNIAIKEYSIVGSVFVNGKSNVRVISMLHSSSIGYISVNEASSINNIFIRESSSCGEISFSNDSHCGYIEISGNSSSSFISIKNSIIGNINIKENSKATNIALNIDSSASDIEVTGKSNIGGINIFKNSFINRIYVVENSSIGQINILESRSNHISISGDSFLTVIYIKKSTIDFFSIHKCNLSDGIFFNDSTIIKLTIGAVTGIHIFVVDGKSYIGEINWIGKEGMRVFINDSDIANLQLSKAVFDKENLLELNDCCVNNVNFNAVKNFGNIYLKNCKVLKKVKVWQRDEFKYLLRDENGLLKVTEESKESRITFTNCDLGKTNFIGCDFTDFDVFEFYNTKMLEVFVAGTKLPNSISIPDNIFQDKISEIDVKFLNNRQSDGTEVLYDLLRKNHLNQQSKLVLNEQQRLAYGQFKKIYDARGDTVTALEYKAKELEVYRQQLRADKKNQNRSERLNLWIHKNTSQYGTNWWMAFWKTMLLAAGCYFIYCIGMGNYPGSNWDLFWENVSHFPEFFNPIHRADALEEKINQHEDINGLLVFARFWNYFSRLIIAFMVYQTIQAFRKHGRSSG